MRIGLFGGSFNPVHKSHIYLSEYVLKELNLDELIFIPCWQSIDKAKSIYAPAFHRVNMLLNVLPPNCSISTWEISKRKAIQSIETIRYFSDLYRDAELFFLIGDDSFETINTWQDFQEIDKLVNLVVFRRKFSTYQGSKHGLKATFLNNPIWEASSSDIRNHKNTHWLDSKVEVYIRENRLYGYVG